MANESFPAARHNDATALLSVREATGSLLGGLLAFVLVLLVVIIPAVRGAPI